MTGQVEKAGAGSSATGAGPIERVVADMVAERKKLTRTDGLGVFIDVYRQVTELVAQRVMDTTFDDPRFVERLDVVFAGIFLDVPRDLVAGRPVSKAWAPLVERRSTRGILPIQFALAGMNAHINHDLALAVVRTCAQARREPTSGRVRDDFERVNAVLAEVVRPVRQSFLDAEVVRVGGALSPVADLVSNFSIDAARDAAWASAMVLWKLRGVPMVGDMAQEALGRTVGLVGRQLLTVVDVP
ncbi:DUF5995 family protein [Oerskovia turbata]